MGSRRLKPRPGPCDLLGQPVSPLALQRPSPAPRVLEERSPERTFRETVWKNPLVSPAGPSDPSVPTGPRLGPSPCGGRVCAPKRGGGWGDPGRKFSAQKQQVIWVPVSEVAIRKYTCCGLFKQPGLYDVP